MLLGPLGLQSQLVGHLKRLAKCQYNLIGQVLCRTKRQTWLLLCTTDFMDFISPGSENNIILIFLGDSKSIKIKFLYPKSSSKEKCFLQSGGDLRRIWQLLLLRSAVIP